MPHDKSNCVINAFQDGQCCDGECQSGATKIAIKLDGINKRYAEARASERKQYTLAGLVLMVAFLGCLGAWAVHAADSQLKQQQIDRSV